MKSYGSAYNRFLGAAGISTLGDGLLVTGLPLLARKSTSNPFLVAGVFVASRIPWLFGIAFGAFADRREARRLMVAMDLVRMFILAALGAALLLSPQSVSLALIIAISAVLASGQIIFFAASQRAVGQLVPTSSLEGANSQFATLTTLTEQAIGPQLGAILVSSPAVPLLGDAASFGLSAALLHKLPNIPPSETKHSFRNDILIGWQWFRTNHTVLLISAIMTATAFLSAGVFATEVPLIIDTLKLHSWAVGAFTICMALGAAAGSALAPKLIERVGYPITPAALFIAGTSFLACMNQRSVIVVFAAMFVQQFATLVVTIATVSIRLRIIPADLRGRVIALSRSAAYGSQVVGGLLGGWIVKQYGTDKIFAFAGGFTVLLSLATARSYRAAVSRTATTLQPA